LLRLQSTYKPALERNFFRTHACDMKTIPQFCLLVFAALVCVPVAAAPTNADKTTTFRLTVELWDGSRVVGNSTDGRLQFHSEVLGDLRLPMQTIRALESQSRTNLVKLTTTSGDSLTVAFDMDAINVEATYGKVALPVGMIKSHRVSTLGQPGRPRDGLVGLWSAEGNAGCCDGPQR
jgi:hypothetical protein